MVATLTDLSMTLKVSLAGTTGKGLDLEAPASSPSLVEEISFAVGAGANQANEAFFDTRTLVGADSEDLDLAGVLENAYGETITFAAIKAIVIVKRSADAEITIGGASSNEFQGPFGATGDKHTIAADGGVFVAAKPDADGWPVVADTGDLLKILNDDGSNTATFDIGIIGESA